MKQTLLKTRTTLIGCLVVGMAHSGAAVLLQFGDQGNPEGVDQVVSWNGVGLEFNTSDTAGDGTDTTTSDPINVDATNGVEAFSFTVTVTANEASSQLGIRTASGGSRSFVDDNAAMQAGGVTVTVGNLTNANVKFEGFTFATFGNFQNNQSLSAADNALINGNLVTNNVNDLTVAPYSRPESLQVVAADRPNSTGLSNFDLGRLTLEFTAVPEPSASLLGGLGILFILRRRRV